MATSNGDRTATAHYVINIPSIPSPSHHFLENDNRELYLSTCVPLNKYALEGNWEAAKLILETKPSLLTSSITRGGDTLLHVAAGARQVHFAEKLVEMMEVLNGMEKCSQDLALRDMNGNTAFSIAAAAGSIEIADIMIKKNKYLPIILGGEGMTPLYIAALLGQSVMTDYLYSRTKEMLGEDDRKSLFLTCIDNGLYDLARRMLENDRTLAKVRNTNEETALHILARMPSEFTNQSPRMWSRLITSSKLAPLNQLNLVSGAALQMQRELVWFEEVKKIVRLCSIEMKNLKGQTPRELFTSEHKELLDQGEAWMKHTANSCMIVAALIVTIVFSAAFSVPGGTSDNTGQPNFLKETAFQLFAIADGIALVSSSTSILMFLFILTSRYAEGDFLKSLPLKLMIGLTSLFISITSMMVAFNTTFYLDCHYGLGWVPNLIFVFAFVPVALFAFLQFPLLSDMFSSTYCSSLLFQPRKHKID